MLTTSKPSLNATNVQNENPNNRRKNTTEVCKQNWGVFKPQLGKKV